MFWPSTAQTIAPDSYGSWRPITLDVPTGTSMVAIRVINNQGSYEYNIGLRRYGSSEDHYAPIYAYDQVTAYVGVDSSKRIEVKIEHPDVILKVVAYFSSDAGWYDTYYDRTPSQLAEWRDMDCSVMPSDAKFAVLEVIANSYGSQINFRNNGSSDDRVPGGCTRHFWVLIPVDGSRYCEGYISNGSDKVYLCGYITAGLGKTNSVGVSLEDTGEWTEIDMDSDNPPAGSAGAIVEVIASNDTSQWGLRKNGTSDSFYYYVGYYHGTHLVGIDGGNVFEGAVSDTAVDFYLWGYAATVELTIDVADTLNIFEYIDSMNEMGRRPSASDTVTLSEYTFVRKEGIEVSDSISTGEAVLFLTQIPTRTLWADSEVELPFNILGDSTEPLVLQAQINNPDWFNVSLTITATILQGMRGLVVQATIAPDDIMTLYGQLTQEPTKEVI